MRNDPELVYASLWQRHARLMAIGITSDGTFWNNKPYKFPRHQIPIRSMSRDQLRFHRAWKSLKGNRQELIWVHYVPHAKLKRKLEVLRMSKDPYFEATDEAHEMIESFIVGCES